MSSGTQPITAAEANRNFSEVLRRVREGGSLIVTSHGRPVARIIPFDADADAGARDKPRRRLLARLAAQPTLDVGRWSRDSLYDE